MRLRIITALASTALAVGQQPASPPNDAAVWLERDLETRWVALQAVVRGGSTETRVAWMNALAEVGDFELIEWVAIYDPDARAVSSESMPLKLLSSNGAPQWLRIAAWYVRNAGEAAKGRLASTVPPGAKAQPDSHMKDESLQLIRDRGAVFLAWFDAFPGGPNRDLEWLADFLREETEPSGEIGDFLPPLDPEVVLLSWLHAPKRLAGFPPGGPAEKRTRYVHQVVRAIRGLVQSGIRAPRYLDALWRLTAHSSDRVRREALLAYPSIPPGAVPWRELLAVVDDASRDAQDVQLAALALSYSDHPQVFFELHRLATGDDVLRRDVGIDRLCELGTTWTMRRFARRLADGGGDDAFGDAIARIRQRIDGASADAWWPHARAMLERVAWAEEQKLDGSDALRDEAMLLLRTSKGERKNLERVLADLEARYVPRERMFAPPVAARIQARVRELAGTASRN